MLISEYIHASAGTMWKKVKQAGKVPHLSRWFDFVSESPECKSTVDELDLNARRKAATATEGTVDSKKGGGGESNPETALHSVWKTQASV